MSLIYRLHALFYSKWIAVVSCLFVMSIVTACTDKDKESADSEKSVRESVQTQESIQVATDLDINQLSYISQIYTEGSGIKIEWIPIDAALFPIAFDEEAPVDFSLNLPEGIDMVMMHSAYSLANAKASHALQPIGSDVLVTTVPKQYQDEEGYWFGIGQYARTLIFNKQRVNEPELINYAGLSAEKWQGRLCMTDIYSPENQAIAKVMWHYRGAKATPEVLAKWQRNMSVTSTSNEEVIKNIEQGRCDVGIVDSDVFWHYAKNNPTTQIRMMWANQINRGVMTNAISVGLINSGDDVGHAVRFMEWLISEEGQAVVAFSTSTFPVITLQDERINIASVKPEWATFDADPTPLSELIANHKKIMAAVLLTESEVATDDDSSESGENSTTNTESD